MACGTASSKPIPEKATSERVHRRYFVDDRQRSTDKELLAAATLRVGTESACLDAQRLRRVVVRVVDENEQGPPTRPRLTKAGGRRRTGRSSVGLWGEIAAVPLPGPNRVAGPPPPSTG